ncbi:cellulase family glycosylhydrolase [Planctomycetes bacterium K23_9]|uniref:Cellulase (Glycosyl hydrolase family 5) n=1 Tax=Stieleria marina TaxID=1930275 RepID=A0A517NV86_9BACT|nr:Cellulase (glycosyl hydrolase family 5) [Planctomycetes bacterium K23_9]
MSNGFSKHLGRFLVAFAAVLVVCDTGSLAADPSAESKLGRVKIASHRFGMTVVAANGDLLRGTSLMIFSYGKSIGKSDHIYDDAYWQLLADSGVNAVRLACFDAWQQAHGAPGSSKPYPFTDFNDPQQTAEILKDYDQVVDAAGRHGMYVMVNYHNTGGYRDPDLASKADSSSQFGYLDTTDSIKRFWQIVAPRYKDRQHVFYELMNEPVQWFPENYTDQVLDDIQTLHDQVRSAAPKTHLVLVSAPNHLTWNPQRGSLVGVARKLKLRGIEFDNASIGVHTYNTKHPQPNQAGPVLKTMKEFPVINTEANLPRESNDTPSDGDGSGFDRDRLISQSMERLKISWFHWKTHSPQELQKTWIDVVLKDAKAKGYFWAK